MGAFARNARHKGSCESALDCGSVVPCLASPGQVRRVSSRVAGTPCTITKEREEPVLSICKTALRSFFTCGLPCKFHTQRTGKLGTLPTCFLSLRWSPSRLHFLPLVPTLFLQCACTEDAV